MTVDIQRTDSADCIRLETANPDCAMIWLHGLGATNEDFVPVFKRIVSSLSLNCVGLFPQAPTRPVTFSGGMSMPCWYDILGANPKRIINEDDLQAAAAGVHHLLQSLLDEGIAPQRIFIAGFSQGGAVAYESAMSYNGTLAGLITLSTYIGRPMTPANTALPVFCAHGTQDDVVPIALGEAALNDLQTMGLTPEWKTYPMQHEVCLPEIADISDFVARQLGQ